MAGGGGDTRAALGRRRLANRLSVAAQQQIRLDILNSVTNLEGSKEQLKLARIARDLAQKNTQVMLEGLLRSLGFEQITITFDPPAVAS